MQNETDFDLPLVDMLNKLDTDGDVGITRDQLKDFARDEGVLYALAEAIDTQDIDFSGATLYSIQAMGLVKDILEAKKRNAA